MQLQKLSALLKERAAIEFEIKQQIHSLSKAFTQIRTEFSTVVAWKKTEFEEDFEEK